MSLAEHVEGIGERRVTYRVLLGKPEGDEGVARRIIYNDLQELGCGGVDWIYLTQERDRWQTLVNAVMKLRVP
jgi:hypothetical protein